jgi:hypothetical protein
MTEQPSANISTPSRVIAEDWSPRFRPAPISAPIERWNPGPPASPDHLRSSAQVQSRLQLRPCDHAHRHVRQVGHRLGRARHWLVLCARLVNEAGEQMSVTLRAFCGSWAMLCSLVLVVLVGRCGADQDRYSEKNWVGLWRGPAPQPLHISSTKRRVPNKPTQNINSEM